MKKTIYISGPMRGLPEFNFPSFDHVERVLTDWGHTVLSPARRDREDGFDPTGLQGSPEELAEARFDFNRALRDDLKLIARADMIVMLPGWFASEGARMELTIAHWVGLEVRYWCVGYDGYRTEPDHMDASPNPQRHPSSQRLHDLLDEAAELHDKKQADYGRENDPFANVRASEEFGIPGWIGALIRMNDKMRRLQAAAQGSTLKNEGIEDSFMDLAVYALIGLVLYEEAQS